MRTSSQQAPRRRSPSHSRRSFGRSKRFIARLRRSDRPTETRHAIRAAARRIETLSRSANRSDVAELAMALDAYFGDGEALQSVDSFDDAKVVCATVDLLSSKLPGAFDGSECFRSESVRHWEVSNSMRDGDPEIARTGTIAAGMARCGGAVVGRRRCDRSFLRVASFGCGNHARTARNQKPRRTTSIGRRVDFQRGTRPDDRRGVSGHRPAASNKPSSRPFLALIGRSRSPPKKLQPRLRNNESLLVTEIVSELTSEPPTTVEAPIVEVVAETPAKSRRGRKSKAEPKPPREKAPKRPTRNRKKEIAKETVAAEQPPVATDNRLANHTSPAAGEVAVAAGGGPENQSAH